MDCSETRSNLLPLRRGLLDPDVRAAAEAHLAGCPACRQEAAADRELSLLFEERLSSRRAPASLRRALKRRWDSEGSRIGRGLRAASAFALGAAMTLLAVALWRGQTLDRTMLAEAVNDHLRILYSEHPLEVESGGIHQVKPWFEGRVDFAPVLAFAGDDDFALQGGQVGYFVDRKAAAFVFKRRLHVITLFVFQAEGMHFPMRPSHSIGQARGSLETSRGFHLLLWREADLGYALVSDVAEADLLTLGAKIAGPQAGAQ